MSITPEELDAKITRVQGDLRSVEQRLQTEAREVVQALRHLAAIVSAKDSTAVGDAGKEPIAVQLVEKPWGWLSPLVETIAVILAAGGLLFVAWEYERSNSEKNAATLYEIVAEARRLVSEGALDSQVTTFYFSVWYQNEKGLIEDAIWVSLATDFCGVIRKNPVYFESQWPEEASFYPAGFNEFIKRLAGTDNCTLSSVSGVLNAG